jgi:hypothetical protein
VQVKFRLRTRNERGCQLEHIIKAAIWKAVVKCAQNITFILKKLNFKIPTRRHYIALYYLLSHALHVSGAYHTHHQELSTLFSQASGVDRTAMDRTVTLAYKILKD